MYAEMSTSKVKISKYLAKQAADVDERVLII